MLTRLAAYAGDAPIVFAGARRRSCCARSRARGTSAASGSSARLRRRSLPRCAAIVAMEARCSPSEVDLTVLGTPPSGSSCRGARRRLADTPRARAVPGPADADRSASGASVATGPFALGLAAARVTEAIVRPSRRAFSVLTVLGGEFGVRGRVGAIAGASVAVGHRHARGCRR